MVFRAKTYGWQNTYVFTKAMGEMMINSVRGDVPVVIIRPSVIESIGKEPLPGWIQGNRLMTFWHCIDMFDHMYSTFHMLRKKFMS